jgi:DNA invertase Pin-like site-specific DNA recombinase
MDAQREAVARYVHAFGGELLAEFVEVESGRRNDRPELKAALDRCHQKRAMLVIARIDRLVRNLAFISRLFDSGIELVCCDMPDATRLTLHIMAAVAEHESELIIIRTKAALQAAKARGIQLGNPSPNLKAATAAASEKAAAFREGILPYLRTLRGQGLTLRQIAAELNARHIPPARGPRWNPSTICLFLQYPA